MAYGKELWRRLFYLLRRSRFQSELSDEMQFHIESRAEELEHGGVPRKEALARARREFGPAARAVEDTHGAWQIRWLEDLFSDLRYALRAFRRNPGFALTAIACLALGIGANTTIFSITTGFLFSLPSCRDAASLVHIEEGGNSNATITDYKLLRDTRIFDGMAGINPETQVNWRDGDRTTRLYAALVTDDYFSTLGVPFLLGRGIAPAETTTVVLSNRLWHRRFAADSSVLGRKIVLDGRIYTVAGVLPADHRTAVGFGFSPEIYVPALHDDDTVQLYARMSPAMTVGIARARLTGVLRELDRLHPHEGWKRTDDLRIGGVTGIAALENRNMMPVLAFFGMLMIVVALVLLIACANVASLLLARASSRSQELAIRLALGAGRTRIVRHLLAESLLLAAAGAIAGLALDLACVNLLGGISLPLPIPLRLIVAPDWRLLLYSACLAIVTALVAGLLPALKAVRKDVNAALRSEERQTGRAWGLRAFLVAGQLALSIVLLATGFLFVHNLLRATSMNPGFDVKHTIWAFMRLVPERYTDPARQMSLVREALARLRALPGVEAAAVTHIVPLNDQWHNSTSLQTDISTKPIQVRFEQNSVGPDYFRAIGIPILRGREFSPRDRTGSPPVVVVNQTFARYVFGNLDPVGHVITFYGTKCLIVGIAKDSKYATLGEDPKPALYGSYFQNDEQVTLHFIVRTAASPFSYGKPISDTLARLDSTAAIETKPMSQGLGMALLPSQAGAAMLGAMGVLGLALASIGLYGVLLYSVSRRTREIGLRVALGATPSAVLRLVCRDSFTLVGAGMSAGLLLAFFATRPLAMFLVPGLGASDPFAFLAVTAVLAAVALLATLAPALRALRVDPMTALRHE